MTEILLGQVGIFWRVARRVYTRIFILSKHVLAKMNPWVGTAFILGPVFAVFIFDLGPEALRQGLTLYMGASLIFSFFMRYGGCEVISIPSLFFGNRFTVYCPYNAIDVMEKTVTDRRSKVPR